MSRRIVVALTAALAAALPLAASDDSCTHDTLPRVQAVSPAASPIDALFSQTAAESVEGEDGVTAAAPSMEMVVARIGPDGKLVLACFDSPAAAKRFLEEKTPAVPVVERAAEK